MDRQGILQRIPIDRFFQMQGPFGANEVMIAIDPAYGCPECSKPVRIMLHPEEVQPEPTFFCVYCSGYQAAIVQALHEEIDLQRDPGFEGLINTLQGVFGPRSEWWDRPIPLNPGTQRSRTERLHHGI